MNEDFEVISTYSRAQAIEDGVLFDVSKRAREVGIKYPVAITSGVQSILEDVGDSGCQDYEGRLWDLLMVFRTEASKIKGDTIYFSVHFLTPKEKLQEEKFWAKCCPGDNMDPVITIMLIGED